MTKKVTIEDYYKERFDDIELRGVDAFYRQTNFPALNLLPAAILYNRIDTIKILLDHYHIGDSQMTLKERLAYYQLLGDTDG